MENASKALIIAGAILIAILLIAVSMYIYNSSQDTIQGAGASMSQQARDAYNAKIVTYVGKNKSANDVRALIDNIISSNNENVNQTGRFISVITNRIISAAEGSGYIRSVDLDGDEENEDAITFKKGESNDDANVSGTASILQKLKSKINASSRYDVEANYESGIITSISIEKK